VPLAFCILAHKNPQQVGRLLRAISQPGNTYILHYDRRASRSEHLQIQGLTDTFPGLHVLPPRAVNWGRWSQMQVQLDMMAWALGQHEWTHLFTISGQDFPLLSVKKMEAGLAIQKNQSFISWFDPTSVDDWPNAEERLSRWYLDSSLIEGALRLPFVGRRIRRLMRWQNTFPTLPVIRRRPPHFFKWLGGANHHLLARPAVRCLLEDQYSRRIAAWTKHSGHPDETFVQSALINSPLAATVVNDDRRAIFWDDGAPSPRTMTLSDLPALRAARAQGKLFARKFDPAMDEQVIHELERDLEP
jgi:hypothetical protein